MWPADFVTVEKKQKPSTREPWGWEEHSDLCLSELLLEAFCLPGSFPALPPRHRAGSAFRLLGLWLHLAALTVTTEEAPVLSIRTPSSAVHTPEVDKLVPWT